MRDDELPRNGAYAVQWRIVVPRDTLRSLTDLHDLHDRHRAGHGGTG